MAYSRVQAEKRVKALVAHMTGVKVSELSASTDLFTGVAIDGLDAEELLLEFCRRFGVDGAAIQFDRHFGPEAGFNPFALLRPSWWEWHRMRIPVTIEVLTQAAMTGRWPINYGNVSK